MVFRPLTVAGRPVAQGRLPAVCAPLVAAGIASLVEEARRVAALQPDLLEWRVDFFQRIADTPAVLAAARALREAVGDLPILFTRRSIREGGQVIPLDEPGVAALYEAVAINGTVQWLDWELSADASLRARVQAAARSAGLQVVMSCHDFARTPAPADMLATLQAMDAAGADVAKLAVMPQSMADVHALLGVTLEAAQTLRIPVVTMAMGGLGAVTRLCGGVFGSALTFAVGSAASAPGQMPIADVRAALAVLQRATSG